MNHGILRISLLVGCLAGLAGKAEIVSTGGDFAVRGQVRQPALPSSGGDFVVIGSMLAGAGQPSQGGDYAAMASPDPSQLLLLPATAAIPEVRIVLQGDQVLLSWPAGPVIWRVETLNSLDSAGVWRDVGVNPVSVDGQFLLRAPVGAVASFFRLRR